MNALTAQTVTMLFCDSGSNRGFLRQLSPTSYVVQTYVTRLWERLSVEERATLFGPAHGLSSIAAISYVKTRIKALRSNMSASLTAAMGTRRTEVY